MCQIWQIKSVRRNESGGINKTKDKVMAKKASQTPTPETEQPAETTNYALKLFGTPAQTVDFSKLKRRNLPTLIKPGDVPMDGIVSGTIIDVVDSMTTTIKGKLLWLKHDNGTEFLFPCTGVIRNALVPGVPDGELKKKLEAEVGKKFFAKRLPDKTSQKYKKNMFMFDVFTN